MTLHAKTPPLRATGLRNSVRLAGLNTSGDNTEQAKYQVTLTAIPWDDARWAMKAVGPEGQIRLPGIFHSRLEALGACVLLAAQCNGEVLA
jgi:hypothetical protein